MKRVIYALATSALLLGGATLAIAQGPGGTPGGPGGSPGGDPKPSAKDVGPSPGDMKGGPDKKEPGAMRDAPGKGPDGSRAGKDDGGKKAAAPSDTPKGSKDGMASDRGTDKSDRKATDTRRKDETPKAASPKDSKSDPKAADTRKDDPKTAAPKDDKSDKKATDTRGKDETPKASAPDSDRTGKTASPGTDGKKGVELTEQKRTTVHERLSRDRTRHVTNVRFTVSVGATVPRNVQLYQLPPDVIEVVPEYRSYRYVWVGDEIVIIDPARYVVVAVVGGGGRTAVRREGRFTLSEAERRVVLRYVGGSNGPVVHDRVDIGGHIPESVTLSAFPDEVIAEVPRLRDYRFVFVEDDIAIVDPNDLTVVVKIDN